MLGGMGNGLRNSRCPVIKMDTHPAYRNDFLNIAETLPERFFNFKAAADSESRISEKKIMVHHFQSPSKCILSNTIEKYSVYRI